MLCSLRPPLFSRVPVSALAVHRRSIGIARSFATSSTTATTPRASPKLITTPIFYVNAAPHVGHLHSMLLADVFARYARLREPDVPVVFSTGTDEHGLKIQTAARNAGMTELAMCDANSGRFRALAEAANISYTDFIRTSEPRHYRAVERFWNDLVAGGHIYKGSHSGWYAVSDECFYTASQIQDAEDGTKVSIESGSKVEWVEEENYKFRLSAFKEPLTKWLQANPNAVVPAYQRDAVINSLDTLSDLSISRPASRLQWGVPVPNDPDHTIYVWVDALVNYLTVLGYPSSDQSVDWSSAAVAEGQGWPAELQVVGKDIVRFHAVYWPALLMANGLPPPKTLLVHAHWTQNRFKMSKSLGNVADPFEAIARAGVDSVRSYLMASGGRLAEDSDYSYPSLVLHHKLLSDQIGNLLSRLSGKKVTGKIISTPELAAGSPSSQITAIDEVDEEIDTLLRTTRDSVGKHMDGLHPGAAITEVMLLVAAANRHYSALQPWVSLPPTYTNLLRAYLYTYHALRVTAILLSPIMPTKAHELLDALSVPEEGRTWESATFSLREEGEGEVGVLAEKVAEGMRRRGKKVLFARIFEEAAEEGKTKKT